MSITDCYRAETTTAAYSLRWSWTGWPSLGSMPSFTEDDWSDLAGAWEQDGIRLLERKCQDDYWQATVSAKPNVNPSFIVARIKGRIDHRFRSQKVPFKFSRKVSLRAIGNNTTADVQDYIHRQVDSAQFCSSDFAQDLKQFTRVWQTEDLYAPIEVSSGRYWYLLHLVLVVDGRHRIGNLDFLGRLFEACQAIAVEREYLLGGLSVMPDHLHLCLRGKAAESPEAIALDFMNESCRELRVAGLWRPSYYVGTTGAYNMNAVRR
jgi:REP element-mobilizing transposase RayT